MILRFFLPVVLALICVACQAGAGAAAPAAQKDSATALRASLESIFQGSSLLVLGEVHGTNEAPRFALAAVEAAVGISEQAGCATVLGLEMGGRDQRAIDKYVASGGSEADRAALAGSDHWELTSPDGRGSEAMFELVDGVRELREGGADVRIHCFNREGYVGDPNPWGKLKADSLMGVLDGSERTNLVVLVGSSHAATNPLGEPPMLPMGGRLLEAHPSMVTLKLRTAGGESWCMEGTPGIYPMKAKGQPDAYGIELFDEPDKYGFHGVFDVGIATASLPVKPGAYERLLKEMGVDAPR